MDEFAEKQKKIDQLQSSAVSDAKTIAALRNMLKTAEDRIKDTKDKLTQEQKEVQKLVEEAPKAIMDKRTMRYARAATRTKGGHEFSLYGVAQFRVDVRMGGEEGQLQRLHEVRTFFESMEISQCIIYIDGQDQAELMRDALEQFDVTSVMIHANTDKREYQRALALCRDREVKCIITTRPSLGVDGRFARFVFNASLPKVASDYVSRVGRPTAYGLTVAEERYAFNIVGTEDEKILETVQNLFSMTIPYAPLGIDAAINFGGRGLFRRHDDDFCMKGQMSSMQQQTLPVNIMDGFMLVPS